MVFRDGGAGVTRTAFLMRVAYPATLVVVSGGDYSYHDAEQGPVPAGRMAGGIMKRIISFLVLLLAAILAIGFAVLNADSVELNYYFGSSQAPLSLLLVLAVIVGALLGVLASAGMLVRARRDNARLRKNVDLSRREVMNLRAIPLRDKH